MIDFSHTGNEMIRRDFLKRLLLQAGLAGGADKWLLAKGTEPTTPGNLTEIRDRTLEYIESMRITVGNYGRYRYSSQVSEPTLYSSTYAAMTRHLYRDLESASDSEREQWINLLQSHQDDDGLFRDPVIFGEGWYRNDPLSCGRSHLSCHVLTALTCLGAVADRPMRWLDQFLNQDNLVEWLEKRDWGRRVAWSGNEVLNVATLMQYARDYQTNEECGTAVEVIRNWMADRCDPETGLWGVGPLKLDQPKDLSNMIQAAYHFWLIWFYDDKIIPFPKQAVAQVLRTQNSQGSFGWGVHNHSNPHDGSACEDIDSIDPLARLEQAALDCAHGESVSIDDMLNTAGQDVDKMRGECAARAGITGDRNVEIQQSLTRAVPWLLSNQTPHGSFCFKRGQGFSYGHPQLTAKPGMGGMFPTWFRTLTLAYLGQALPDSICGQLDWQFCRCPGLQFWTPRNGS